MNVHSCRGTCHPEGLVLSLHCDSRPNLREDAGGLYHRSREQETQTWPILITILKIVRSGVLRVALLTCLLVVSSGTS
jgi:hypothetical protein